MTMKNHLLRKIQKKLNGKALVAVSPIKINKSDFIVYGKEGVNMSKGNYNTSTHKTVQNNDHSNQGNPNNFAHTANSNNHANQCNPNNSAYHSSRGGK